MGDSKKGDLFSFLFQIGVIFGIVFMFSSIILFMTDSSPVSAFYHIFRGAFGSWTKFSHVIKVWVPLTLCSCGLLFTFRINLWNIGVEGQIIAGAVLTTAVLRYCLNFEAGWAALVISFGAGAMGGALWATAAGFLKTKGGVNEIFAGLGLNFLAQGFLLYLIFGPWKRSGTASMSGTELLPQTLWLPFNPSIRISYPAIVLTITSLAATFLVLRYTRLGLGFKAIGKNFSSAVFYGLNPEKYMLYAMIFAGGFAGVAGSIQVTGVYHRLIPSISSNYGYLALLVVMLSGYRVRLAPLVALFFAVLNVGSIQLPMQLQLDSSFSGVVQGLLVLSALLAQSWQKRTSDKGAGPYGKS